MTFRVRGDGTLIFDSTRGVVLIDRRRALITHVVLSHSSPARPIPVRMPLAAAVAVRIGAAPSDDLVALYIELGGGLHVDLGTFSSPQAAMRAAHAVATAAGCGLSLEPIEPVLDRLHIQRAGLTEDVPWVEPDVLVEIDGEPTEIAFSPSEEPTVMAPPPERPERRTAKKRDRSTEVLPRPRPRRAAPRILSTAGASR